jgi:hypothetical protein
MSQPTLHGPVISVSRRCDVPAFYPRWFANRLREGFALVVNPFNPAQVSRVELTPDAAKVFVFWTRNPAPLLSYLGELTSRGQGYYFLHTLVDYPLALEPHAPKPAASLDGFRRLADAIGPDRVVWRYDPIVISDVTGVDYHLRAFERLAGRLAGATCRVTVSLMSDYRKIRARLAGLSGTGLTPREPNPEELARLMAGLSGLAGAHGLEITACAPQTDLSGFGVAPGACIDPVLIERLFGLALSPSKDPGQRPRCGCAPSRDIGAYDACLFGCLYCYATSDFRRARANYQAHDPASPHLLAPCRRPNDRDGR